MYYLILRPFWLTGFLIKTLFFLRTRNNQSYFVSFVFFLAGRLWRECGMSHEVRQPISWFAASITDGFDQLFQAVEVLGGGIVHRIILRWAATIPVVWQAPLVASLRHRLKHKTGQALCITGNIDEKVRNSSVVSTSTDRICQKKYLLLMHLTKSIAEDIHVTCIHVATITVSNPLFYSVFDSDQPMQLAGKWILFILLSIHLSIYPSLYLSAIYLPRSIYLVFMSKSVKIDQCTSPTLTCTCVHVSEKHWSQKYKQLSLL